MSLGLCLSGGGIKGAAHIGVLKALEEAGIKPDYIAGTSSGSIVTALYSVGYTPNEILKLFKKYAKSINYIEYKSIFKTIFGIIFRRKLLLSGLNSGAIIEKIINNACKDKNVENISDIKIPILIPSVDLYSGEVYVFTSTENRFGFSNDIIYINDINIGKAVRASCSYPGIFSPFKYKRSEVSGDSSKFVTEDSKGEDSSNNIRFLIDGATRENTPWKELKKLGADKIICVTFENKLKKQKSNINILDVISRSPRVNYV